MMILATEKRKDNIAMNGINSTSEKGNKSNGLNLERKKNSNKNLPLPGLIWFKPN